MRQWLIKLFRVLDPRIEANGPSMLSNSAREKWLDVIEDRGFKAHLYLPAARYREDKDLSEALDGLSGSGHIITDATGSLVGGVAKCRPSSNEVAEQRRAVFKIVEDETRDN